MLDNVEYDDGDSPAIGLVPEEISWDEVQDHLKIAHNPLLLPQGGGARYAGAYWTGTAMVVIEDLGDDQDEAVSEFRDLLRERGHG